MRNGTRTRGTLDLAGIAKWIDYVQHDACSEADARRLLEPWIASGELVIADGRWRLRRSWP
jgi:hypothetical protein